MNLILLHGALGSADQFGPLLPHLGPDTPVYYMNFPGHGGLSTDDPVFLPQMAEALVQFVKERRLEGSRVFGYSMGGYAALWAASLNPGLFSEIRTLGTKFDWTPEGAEREIAMLDAEKIESKVPQFAAALAQRHAPADWKRVLTNTQKLMLDLGSGNKLGCSELAGINIPVTIARGEFDNMVSEAESMEAASWLPKGKFKTLTGFKHPLEQVDMAVLADYVAGV